MKVKLEMNLVSVPETGEDDDFNLYFTISKQFDANELMDFLADYNGRRANASNNVPVEEWLQNLREQLEKARR